MNISPSGPTTIALDDLAALLVEVDAEHAEVTLAGAVLIARYGMAPADAVEAACDMAFDGPARAAHEHAGRLLATASGTTPTPPSTKAADWADQLAADDERADYDDPIAA